MQSLAIDFGTTNTVLATAAEGVVKVLSLPPATSVIRTALAFRRAGRADTSADIGSWAIDLFIDDPENTRFLQSFKSFAATASFSETKIFARRMGFEDLLATFLAKALARAGVHTMPERIILGRPVTFAGQNPDDALAMQRYAKALTSIGAKDVIYIQEPVAAAYFYAQRLTSPATVLVGDFGGGTSDFSLLRFLGHGQVEALGQSGVGIAGDVLDYRFLDHVVTPHLGKGGTYTSWDKALPIPAHYFASFARWNELCLMNRPAVLNELRDLARTSPEANKLAALITVIEGGESYGLYQAIAKAKAHLSLQNEITFRFACHGLAIEQRVTRADFERWIAPDVTHMLHAATSLLARTGHTADMIDRVFLTGGTSFVPAIRHAFARHFGPAKIETGDELISIAHGLALIGQSRDAKKWSAV